MKAGKVRGMGVGLEGKKVLYRWVISTDITLCGTRREMHISSQKMHWK